MKIVSRNLNKKQISFSFPFHPCFLHFIEKENESYIATYDIWHHGISRFIDMVLVAHVSGDSVVANAFGISTRDVIDDWTNQSTNIVDFNVTLSDIEKRQLLEKIFIV